MENILKNIILHTESLYKYLVALDFDIKHRKYERISSVRNLELYEKITIA